MISTYVVYFINSEGNREGTEIIKANSRDEAITLYKRFFNVQGECIAVPRWDLPWK